MQIISHRGFHEYYPENTLKAFEEALLLGVDALETDLILTKDQHIILHHDNFLTYQGKVAYIRDLTLDEVKKIELEHHQNIPTLEEFLECFSESSIFFFDLKCQGLLFHLKRIFEQFSLNPQRFQLSSFFHSEIMEAADMFPDVSRAMIFTAIPLQWEAVIPQSIVREISLYRGYLTQSTAEELHQLGIQTRVYTVDDPVEAERLKEWGIRGIFTNRPDEILRR